MIVALADPLAPWLEHYDPALLAVHNQLHRRRRPWQGRCAGQDLSVTWAAEPLPLKAPRDVLLLLGHSPVRLRLSAAAVEQVLAPLALQFDAQVLPSLPRSLLLELAVLDLIEALEPLLGHSVQLLEATEGLDQRPFAVHLALELKFGNNPPMGAQLDLSDSAAALVAQLLEQHGQIEADPLPALRQTLSVLAGRQWLSLGELRSLQPGDVLMLEHGPGLLLDLEGRLQARCQRQGESLHMQEELKAPLLEMENTMTDIDAASALDDLPLKLVCQVGSLELTLAQLRELGAGSLLQLNTPTVDGVDLMVNGRRVGQGQLVKIGDGLGVRLLSFATP
jgi:type III secretion protein Q